MTDDELVAQYEELCTGEDELLFAFELEFLTLNCNDPEDHAGSHFPTPEYPKAA